MFYWDSRNIVTVEQVGLLPEGRDERGAPPHPAQRPAGRGTQLEKVPRTEVRELVLFPVTQEILGGVELGRVAREELRRQAVAVRGEEILHETTAMRGELPLEDQQLPWTWRSRWRRKVVTSGPSVFQLK